MDQLNIISETKLIEICDLDKKTMSSREIAELTGKRHDHVLRDIRNMFSNLGTAPSSGLSEYVDSTGRTLPMYVLDKEHTLCLITRYSDVLRMRIIRRWQELEGNPLRSMFEKIKLTKSIIQLNGSTWGKAGNDQKKNKHIVNAYEKLITDQIHQELDLFLNSK